MKRIKFQHRKLKGLWGRAFPEQGMIELHAGMDERTEMEIALHEGVHVLFPALPEAMTDDAGRRLADLLWRLNYRRVD